LYHHGQNNNIERWIDDSNIKLKMFVKEV